MNNDFIFRSGKHKGRTYRWVEENYPRYIDWVMMERPEMLQEKSQYRRKANVVVPDYLQDDEEEETFKWKPLTPNYNFDNEVTMNIQNITQGEKEVRLQITKLKVGLYAKLSKETNTNGSVKYDKNLLLDIIFESEHDNEIKSKLKQRING